MDKYLTREQIKTILNNAPKEVNKEELLKKYDSNGWKIQGYNDTPETSTQPPQEDKGGSTLGNIAKSIVSPVATMVARPIQAVAELAGVSDEAVNKFSKEKLGGIVAPTPQSGADVKKDVGRGIQTVAFGAGGPVAGGAAFGLGASLEKGNDLFSVQTAFDTALGAGAGKVFDLVGKPLVNAAGKVIGEITPKYLKDVASKGTKAIEEFAAKHEIMPQFGKDILNKTSKVSGVVKESLKKDFGIKPSVNKTINAIAETPQGKAGIKAYEEIATKGRNVTSKGVFSPQKLGASIRETEIGTRLSDSGISFGKNNIKNLQNIGTNLNKTEKEIVELLKGDPDMVYNLQKDVLAKKMNSLKVDNSGDFVGDNRKVFNNVIDFGKKILEKTEDNIVGGRSGRTLLDNGLRAKFPSAYKNGFLDTSTPSGAAIKQIRDAWNSHLYEVAPNGSEIQKLIQREADLFFANHNISRKALEQDGVKIVGEIIENFPILKGFGLGALTGSKSAVLYGFK